jgi:hypothetical protein
MGDVRAAGDGRAVIEGDRVREVIASQRQYRRAYVHPAVPARLSFAESTTISSALVIA